MSAHAYIQYADVPDDLIASSSQHVDSETKEKIISFDGCPFSGQLDTIAGRIQIEYPFPRTEDLRNHFIAWLMHHGIHFTVIM